MNPNLHDSDPVRGACYQKIRDCMKEGLQGYYQQHPDLLMDERSQEAIEVSLRGLESIFSVLDHYDMTEKNAE